MAKITHSKIADTVLTVGQLLSRIQALNLNPNLPVASLIPDFGANYGLENISLGEAYIDCINTYESGVIRRVTESRQALILE